MLNVEILDILLFGLRIADCEVADETHLDWVALADGWPR